MSDDDRAGLWQQLRQEYADGGLAESDLDPSPFVMFERWLDQAVAAALPEPNSMVVATVDPDGQPSARTVLLKGVNDSGFAFFTNLGSRKARALEQQPRCSLLFGWLPLQRQIRVEGIAAQLSRHEVEEYFASRPRGSQLGAWASPQSEVVAGPEELTDRYAVAQERFADARVPAPEHWGGYRVWPETFEFWQGRPSRMHDRLRYQRLGDQWLQQRLAP